MPLTVEQAQGRVPVTVLEVHGDLDYSNYLEVIDRVQREFDAGSRHLLIDLSDVPFIGSSGLVALHSAALIMSGQSAPDPEAGWQAFHSLGTGASETQANVKLLGVQPRVEQMLTRTALLRFFETYTDRTLAIDSF
jgi:anti-anti-sigma regulatory factor